MYIRDYNKATTLYDTDAFVVDGSQETMYILVSDLYQALIGSKGFITDKELNNKGYQTKEQVDTNIVARGYITGTQADKLITDKGYQTASQVGTIVESYGYQNSEDVNRIITSKNYITEAKVDEKLEGYLSDGDYVTEDELTDKGYQTASQVTSKITDALKDSYEGIYKPNRNTTIKFLKLMPVNEQTIFTVLLDLLPVNYYDDMAFSRILITRDGISEITLSTNEKIEYKKQVLVYKSNTDGYLYFYLVIPNYNDHNKIYTRYIHPENYTTLNENVTSSWESEISDKTLKFDSNVTGDLKCGVLANGNKVPTYPPMVELLNFAVYNVNNGEEATLELKEPAGNFYMILAVYYQRYDVFIKDIKLIPLIKFFKEALTIKSLGEYNVILYNSTSNKYVKINGPKGDTAHDIKIIGLWRR